MTMTVTLRFHPALDAEACADRLLDCVLLIAEGKTFSWDAETQTGSFTAERTREVIKAEMEDGGFDLDCDFEMIQFS